ncbi:ribosome biogenesis GTP-binding YsxC domain protein [Acinetobacter baumannii 1440422]|nr:ribosome biogenesis GTP-binding YsxC domain protein [Acinetobacter baumannii 1440422]
MRRSEKSKDTKARLAPKQKISYEKKPDPAITAYAVQSLNWLRQAEFLMSAPKLALCVEDVATRLRLPDVQMQENLAQLMH